MRPFHGRDFGALMLVRLAEVIAPALEGLLADHCAPVAFHRGVVCGDELRRDHALPRMTGTKHN
jgi:hypothetical protein